MQAGLLRNEFEQLVELVGKLDDEARRCAEAECWRAALILIGSTVEGALLATATVLEPELRAANYWPNEKHAPQRWTMDVLLNLARRAQWLPSEFNQGQRRSDPVAALEGDVGDAVEFVQRMRNVLAHPGRHVADWSWLDVMDSEMMRPASETAHAILAVVLGHLYAVIDNLG